MIVLSGMSNEAQMHDNLSYMKEFRPLSEAEQRVIRRRGRGARKNDQSPAPAASTVPRAARLASTSRSFLP
jgi:predicted aldo/keto reductase-like oxidoreductase